MQSFLNIKLLTVFLALFLTGIDNGSLLYGQTPHNQGYLTKIRTANKADTSALIISIDSLKVGQRYIISVESNSCFHHSELDLTISREMDGYFAGFKMKGKIEGKSVHTKFRKAKLADYQIDAVRNFEGALIYVSATKYDCTTVDEYTLSIDSLKRNYTVSKCDWQGMEKLVEVLFRKTK